jgi:hypothetical protein
MCRFSEKLLAILLSVLLGLIPLQGAMAGLASLLEQTSEVQQHQMGSHHDTGQGSTVDHGAMMDCENCNTHTESCGDKCSSGHCVSCLLALPAGFSFSVHHTSTSLVMQTHCLLVKQRISSLFRPPRA